MQVGVHQESVSSPLVLQDAVDATNECVKESLLNKILCANNLGLMRKHM